MHPMVKPALRRAWRERQTVQFGITPAHAVVVGPVDTATGSFLDLLDGTRGLPLLRDEARSLGLPDGKAEALVDRLSAAGLLDDSTAGGRPAEALRNRKVELDRLRADLASLSITHRTPGAAMERLAARRTMRVQVRGAGRVGAAVASALSASGVGRVDVLDSGRTQAWDVAPGGLPAESVGERRDVAARLLVRRSAPGRSVRAAASGARPAADGPGSDMDGAEAGELDDMPGGWAAERPERADERAATVSGGAAGLSLVIVAPRDGLAAYVPDPASAERWIATGTPHLYAGVVEATGVVGPLVLPGGTACAGCLTEERTAREPGWPLMLAQWRSGRRASVTPACDLGLATTVAGLTTAHALSFLDGELPASTGARWEITLPLLDWRSERIAPHPACPCGAAGEQEGEGMAVPGAPHDTMVR
ncbi:TOMM precursor leader peptide-binding protein [Streptomyces sp. NBC_01716]|uniref:TOMM precursor leader peptide-binding protein n=1 Tax=Streptomyces sp. NBC_01716 TaxID=2975917 RepID=UPI002E336AEB|nr:TOMM precursor leader peptide-binding protein [Streptomyces sp. NBC_01716]